MRYLIYIYLRSVLIGPRQIRLLFPVAIDSMHFGNGICARERNPQSGSVRDFAVIAERPITHNHSFPCFALALLYHLTVISLLCL